MYSASVIVLLTLLVLGGANPPTCGQFENECLQALLDTVKSLSGVMTSTSAVPVSVTILLTIIAISLLVIAGGIMYMCVLYNKQSQRMMLVARARRSRGITISELSDEEQSEGTQPLLGEYRTFPNSGTPQMRVKYSILRRSKVTSDPTTTGFVIPECNIASEDDDDVLFQ